MYINVYVYTYILYYINARLHVYSYKYTHYIHGINKIKFICSDMWWV